MEEKNDCTMDENRFWIYPLTEKNGTRHTALWVPKVLEPRFGCESVLPENDVYNLVMVDVTESMQSYWPTIVTSWQEHIKDKLKGNTQIYAYGEHVRLLRCEPDLKQEDMEGDTQRDLTAAIRTIRHKVNSCKETNVRVFIICNGPHEIGAPLPESEIRQMKPSSGKKISVYSFGIGPKFPSQDCIDLRSQIHNGNTNIPSLFWAREDEDITDQSFVIGADLKTCCADLELNVEGSVLPGLDKTKSIHLGEWLYFEQPQEELEDFSLSVNGGDYVAISAKTMPECCPFFKGILKQWNSVLIQHHRRYDTPPTKIFCLLESFHASFKENRLKGMSKNEVRLEKKKLKTCEVGFRHNMKLIKGFFANKKWKDDIAFANAILKTTVTNSKYDERNATLKSHSQEKYKTDLNKFQSLYEDAKPEIMNLPSPKPEECCRITKTSTLTELMEEDFRNMFQKSKLELLKDFPMSGIPVFTPVRDASQINPWTMVIKRVLREPYAILSQQALEEYANNIGCSGSKDKSIMLKSKEEEVNVIIPTIPAGAADVLKPLVLSRIYAMMSTFCILKNPHIIDHDAHLAALGCVWLKTLKEFSSEPRPEFACRRINDIVATAKLYMDRPPVQRYIKNLIREPRRALMTKSFEDFYSMKCESLVKPAFLLFIAKVSLSKQPTDKVAALGTHLETQTSDVSRLDISKEQIEETYKLMLFEFLGRCLSRTKKSQYCNGNYQADQTPFIDYFCLKLSNDEKRKAWIKKHSKSIVGAFQEKYGNLLETFFTPEDLISRVRKDSAGLIDGMKNQLMQDVPIGVMMDKVKRLKNFACCGDVTWSTFEIIGRELDLPTETIERILSPVMITIYVSEALQVKQSRKRLQRVLPTHDEALETVKKKVCQEAVNLLRKRSAKGMHDDYQFEEKIRKIWTQEYLKMHRPLVMPLTPQQIVKDAQARGIEVTHETFNNVYKYDAHTLLLRNACQIRECPHYLKPHKNFNQHLSIERKGEDFRHAVHQISRQYCREGTDRVIQEILSKNKSLGPEMPEWLTSLDQLKSVLKVYAEIDEVAL